VFTHVAACVLAKSLRTFYTEGFNRFVSSTIAPIASGWSVSCRAGFAPAGKTAPLHGARSVSFCFSPCRVFMKIPCSKIQNDSSLFVSFANLGSREKPSKIKECVFAGRGRRRADAGRPWEIAGIARASDWKGAQSGGHPVRHRPDGAAQGFQSLGCSGGEYGAGFIGNDDFATIPRPRQP
jgi:hypothetical protein